MYDIKLTKGEFDGTPKLKKKYRRIYTQEGDLAGALTDKRIYDLNGEVIAKFVDKEKKENDLGEKEVVITYRAEKSAEGAKSTESSGGDNPEKIENDSQENTESPENAGNPLSSPAATPSPQGGQASNEGAAEASPAEQGIADNGEQAEVSPAEQGRASEEENEAAEYTLVGNKVYRGEEYIGLAESKRKTRVIIIPLIFLLGAAALLFGIWALTPTTPEDIIPVITVQDDDGYWGEGEIAVLDEFVYPERSGEYTFKIYNPHEVDLRYSFKIQAGYNGKDLTDEEAEEFPLLFRLKMNNAYMVDESHIESELYVKMIETGLTAEELAFFDFKILAEAETEFTLEWFWPFESGRDELDTRYGIEAGQMYLTLTLTAEEW